jgi:hypothetical protein
VTETNDLSLEQFKLLSGEGILQQYYTYIKFVMPNPALDQSREEADSKKHKSEPASVLHIANFLIFLLQSSLAIGSYFLLSGFVVFICVTGHLNLIRELRNCFHVVFFVVRWVCRFLENKNLITNLTRFLTCYIKSMDRRGFVSKRPIPSSST